MVDGRHDGKYWECHNSPTNRPIWTKLGCSHTITFPTYPPSCGCRGNVCCLATAHWTFCSHGRLDGQRVNQFWWNLVHSSKLGPTWQSRDQILIFFFKFKMTDARHVATAAMLENIGNAITRLPMDRFERNFCGRIPSCSRHVHDVVARVTAVA